jgi:hypothetical protein
MSSSFPFTPGRALTLARLVRVLEEDGYSVHAVHRVKNHLIDLLPLAKPPRADILSLVPKGPESNPRP